MRRRLIAVLTASFMAAMLLLTSAGAAFADGSYSKKVTICHVPPGNPANAHTITVSENAVPAHLAHGDYLGQCKTKY
jgi:hypothetical protein